MQQFWKGAFKQDSASFHSTFWKAVENHQIGMMQYLVENPSHVDKFHDLKWSCLHTIAYTVHPKLITDKVTRKHHTSIFASVFLDI